MSEDTRTGELVSIGEFARRMDVKLSAVQYAISKGRIALSGKVDGQSKLIDWDSQSKAWEANRRTSARKYTKKNPDGSPKKYNRLEKHIGDSEVYDTGQMGIDQSSSKYDKISFSDSIQAPVGSVAYYQAQKLAVDVRRNLLKLEQEAGRLIPISVALAILGEILAQIRDIIQNSPALESAQIMSKTQKAVKEWKSTPENLYNDIYSVLFLDSKEILRLVAEAEKDAPRKLKDFIDESTSGK